MHYMYYNSFDNPYPYLIAIGEALEFVKEQQVFLFLFLLLKLCVSVMQKKLLHIDYLQILGMVWASLRH